MAESELWFVYSPIKQIRDNPVQVAVGSITVLSALVSIWSEGPLRMLALAILLLGFIGGQRRYGWIQALLH